MTGDPVSAAVLARELVARHPENLDGWMVLAVADPALGDAEAGIAAGKRAYALARTERERYEAARVTARSAYAAGNFSQSQLWLRRAALSAPTAADTARTRRDFRVAGARKPLNLRLNFGFSRSDNINDGSSGSLLIVEGVPVVGVLSPTAQALSGSYLWGIAEATLRLGESARHRTELELSAYAREVWLSGESQDAAPDADNGDFRQISVELGWERRQLLGEGGTELRTSLSVGQQTFGGELANRYAEFGLGVQHRVGEAASVGLSGQVQRRVLNEAGTLGETGLQVTLDYTGRVGQRDQLRLQLRVDHTVSDRGNNNATWTEARASYALGRPIGPVSMSFDLGFGYGYYPDYSLGLFSVPGGRQDSRVFGAIEIAPARFQIGGFAPVLTLTASRTGSNVSRFDRSELAAQLGIRSVF